jgi:WD40 repeat protein
MLPEFKRQRCSYRDVPCQQRVERLAVEGSVEVEAVAPDGEYAATSRVDGVARIWRASSAQPLLSQPNGRVFGLSTKYATLGLMTLDGFGRPDANKLRLRIIRLGDAFVVAELALEDGLREAVFSPDGERLLLVTDDYALRMIELTTGRPLWQLPGGKGIRRVVFSGDSRLLAATQPAASDGSVDILNVATGNPVREAIHGSAGASVMVLTLGDDGALLAVGEVSGGLAVHGTASGRQVMRASHNDQIVDIALSADHRLLATASADGSTRIFDLRQGREVARIVAPSPPTRVRFSPSGRHLAIGSADSVRLWPLRPDELVAEACRRVPRDMSVDEWHLYLPNDAPRACREAMTRLEQR